MGRLPKKGVDYFPHDVFASLTPTLFTIQQEFGNDGYAFWFKLLEFIGMQKGLYADFSNEKDWRYFLSIARVDREVGEKVMTSLAELDAIDRELWRKHRAAWSDNFAERLASLYCRRGTPLPTKPEFEDTVQDGETQQPKPADAKKPRKKKTAEKEEDDKVKYADYVSMTENEYKSLVERIGESAAKKCVEVLDNYKGSTGKTYKNDYRAILNWVVDKVQKEHPQLFKKDFAPEGDGGNPFDDV